MSSTQSLAAGDTDQPARRGRRHPQRWPGCRPERRLFERARRRLRLLFVTGPRQPPASTGCSSRNRTWPGPARPGWSVKPAGQTRPATPSAWQQASV